MTILLLHLLLLPSARIRHDTSGEVICTSAHLASLPSFLPPSTRNPASPFFSSEIGKLIYSPSRRRSFLLLLFLFRGGRERERVSAPPSNAGNENVFLRQSLQMCFKLRSTKIGRLPAQARVYVKKSERAWERKRKKIEGGPFLGTAAVAAANFHEFHGLLLQRREFFLSRSLTQSRRCTYVLFNCTRV